MNRLKFLRKESRLSLRELSKNVGISNSVLSYLETGARPFRQEHLDILTAFFNVTNDYLLGRSDYGLNVFPQFGQDEMTLTEGEYLRLRENITISLVRQGNAATVLNVDTPKVTQNVAITKMVVYRELKGRMKDYDTGESLSKRLDELKSRMTSDDLEKTIRFIEDYILK